MPITNQQAGYLAMQRVKSIEEEINCSLAILEDETVNFDKGWLFFYNTKEFSETRNDLDSLAGNGPIFVSKSGDIKILPTTMSWTAIIDKL